MSVQTSYATAPDRAFAGMLADDSENDIMTMKNADVVSMPFGIGVSFKTSSPTSERDSILPTASAEKLAGIVVHSHDYERTFTLPDGTVAGELDGTGLVAGAEMAVLVRGTIWVQVMQTVAVGDRPWINVTVGAGSAYTAQGQFGNAQDTTGSGLALDITKLGRYTSAASAGGFAKLQIDFTSLQ